MEVVYPISYKFYHNGRKEDNIQTKVDDNGNILIFNTKTDRWVFESGEVGKRVVLKYRCKHKNEFVTEKEKIELENDKLRVEIKLWKDKLYKMDQ